MVAKNEKQAANRKDKDFVVPKIEIMTKTIDRDIVAITAPEISGMQAEQLDEYTAGVDDPLVVTVPFTNPPQCFKREHTKMKLSMKIISITTFWNKLR